MNQNPSPLKTNENKERRFLSHIKESQIIETTEIGNNIGETNSSTNRFRKNEKSFEKEKINNLIKEI